MLKTWKQNTAKNNLILKKVGCRALIRKFFSTFIYFVY